MAKKNAPDRFHFTDRRLEQLEPPKKGQRWVWDTEPRWLAVRLRAGGSKTFYAQYRIGGKLRWLNIGAVEVVTLQEARDQANEARRLAREGRDSAIERKGAVKANIEAPTVREMGGRYLRWSEHKKKPRSVDEDRRMIEKVLIPEWGDRKFQSIGPNEVFGLWEKLSEKHPIRANRVRALVSHMWTMGLEWRLCSGTSPASTCPRNPENEVHNPFGDEEKEALGKALREMRKEAQHALANPGRHRTNKPRALTLLRELDAIELLALTGARRNEIVNLKWSEVDLDHAIVRLETDKSTKRNAPRSRAGRTIWLCTEALEIIARQERPESGEGFVFPGRTEGKPLQGINHVWLRVRKRAELSEKYRIHDLRHTTGSTAAEMGAGQAQIAAGLGHRNVSTAARYSRPHNNPTGRLAATVGSSIAQTMRKSESKADGGPDDDEPPA